MTALDAIGRTAEATACFHSVRQHLADELGLDPSPDLQQLYLSMLRRPPALGPASAGTTFLGPAQLPGDVAGFTGRRELLAQLDKLATAGEASTTRVVFVIVGSAGVGKTALAVHRAHRWSEQFADGQLYVNMRGYARTPPLSAIDAITQILRSLGYPAEQIPTDLDPAAAFYRSVLAERRLLIILDNAQRADHVRPLLPGSPSSLVVVTSRDSLTGLVACDGAHAIELAVLAPADARLLLQRALSDRGSALVDDLDAVAQACGCLPLALRIAAAHLVTRPVMRLRSYLAELITGDRLTALDIDNDPHAAVRATFELSFAKLSDPAQHLFTLLGLHPGPDIDTAAAASLADSAVDHVRPVLTELTNAHLVVEHPGGRFSMHDLLHTYAPSLTFGAGIGFDRARALRRMFDHYLGAAHTAARLINPHRDPIAPVTDRLPATLHDLDDETRALSWFSLEHPVLVAFVHQAARERFDTHAWQLAWTLVDFFSRRGHWHEWANTQQVALDAARRLGDRSAQAHAHRFLAGAYTLLARYDDAIRHDHHALRLYEDLDDQVGRGRTEVDVAWVYELQQDYRQALRHARLSLDAFFKADHQVGIASALNSVGWYHTLLGEHAEALTCCHKSLDILRALGHREGEAGALDSLGYASHHLGRLYEATDFYSEAIAIYHEIAVRRVRRTRSTTSATPTRPPATWPQPRPRGGRHLPSSRSYNIPTPTRSG